MPLPVLHAFTGYSVWRLHQSHGHRSNWKFILLCCFLANLPDFDFLPGIMIEKAAHFHRGPAHSLGAALMVAAVVSLALVFRPGRKAAATAARRGRDYFYYFTMTFLSYFSHVLLDLWNLSIRGVMMLWPFTDKVFYSPLTWFGHTLNVYDLDRAGGMHDFFRAVFTADMAHAILSEIGIVFFIWGLITVFRPVHHETGRHVPLAFSRCGTAVVILMASAMIG